MAQRSLKAAFYEAVSGAGIHKLVAAESFTGMGLEAAKVQVTRALSPTADRHPTFALLETILRRNPDPVLRWIEETCRVRIEPIPDLPQILRQRALERMDQMMEQLDLLRDALQQADEIDEQTEKRMRA